MAGLPPELDVFQTVSMGYRLLNLLVQQLMAAVRVWIVEDEQIVAADLELKLKPLGLDVVGTTSSGKEAITMADRSRPELVLLDIHIQGK